MHRVRVVGVALVVDRARDRIDNLDRHRVDRHLDAERAEEVEELDVERGDGARQQR
jgi:hypothetical protein